jgi:hypothetical protein
MQPILPSSNYRTNFATGSTDTLWEATWFTSDVLVSESLAYPCVGMISPTTILNPSSLCVIQDCIQHWILRGLAGLGSVSKIADTHDSTHRDCCGLALRLHLALHLLQTCRQIYGEAALIPFTQNTFVAEVWYSISPLRAFLATLVPAQVKSITNLLMAVARGYDLGSPRYMGMLKLKGLRSLHLVLPEVFHAPGGYFGTRSLRSRLDGCELGSLGNLDLKSVEISCMFTSQEHKIMESSEVEEVGRVVEGYRKEILGSPGVYLARRKADQEEVDRVWNARQASVRRQILRNRR